MSSIVSCPGCRKRMKIGADKPGGKLRCPSCNTAFVLGNQTGNSFGGTPEFQAFELFEAGKETLPPRSMGPFSSQTAPFESGKATLPPREGLLFPSESFGMAGLVGQTITQPDNTSECMRADDNPPPESEIDHEIVFLPKNFDPFAVRKTAAATIISTAANLPFLSKAPTEIVSQSFDVVLRPVQAAAPEIPVVPMAANDDNVIEVEEPVKGDVQDRQPVLIAGLRIWQVGLILLLIAAGTVFLALAIWLVIRTID